MEKALTKVGTFWVSKKAKEELSHITQDLSVCAIYKIQYIMFYLKKLHYLYHISNLVFLAVFPVD